MDLEVARNLQEQEFTIGNSSELSSSLVAQLQRDMYFNRLLARGLLQLINHDIQKCNFVVLGNVHE